MVLLLYYPPSMSCVAEQVIEIHSITLVTEQYGNA